MMLFTLQRYKFLSKSQHLDAASVLVQDVVYLAKVQISKQITTLLMLFNGFQPMLFTLQRYKFLSKSQRSTIITQCLPDVVYLAKVQISKQITTPL